MIQGLNNIPHFILMNLPNINNHAFHTFNTTWQPQTNAVKAPKATALVTAIHEQLQKSMTLDHALSSTSC